MNAGQPIPCVVVPAEAGNGTWIAAAVDAGYLKMCRINVTVVGDIAYASLAGARMTNAQNPSWTTRSLHGNGAAINDFYFRNSFLCLTAAFGICTTPVSSANGLGFGVYSLDYSIIGPPSMGPTRGENDVSSFHFALL